MTRNTKEMTHVRETLMAQSNLLKRMEELPMSDGDRQAAAEWLRDGESLADCIRRSTDTLRATASFLERRYLVGGR